MIVAGILFVLLFYTWMVFPGFMLYALPRVNRNQKDAPFSRRPCA